MAIVDNSVKARSKAKIGPKAFNWRHWDKWSFFSIIILLITSVVFVYSSSVYDSINSKLETPYLLALKQTIFGIIGLIIYWFTLKIPTRLYYKLVVPIVSGTIGLMCLPFLFAARNGAHRWIELGMFTVQPAELAKLTIVLIWSYTLSTKVDDFTERWKVLKKKRAPLAHKLRRIWFSWRFALVSTAILLAQCYAQSDNGSIIISIGLIIILIFSSGALSRKWNIFFIGLIVSLVLFVCGIYFYVGSLGPEVLSNLGDKTGEYDYVLGRFVAWVDPFSAYSGAGYQIANSLIAIANGGLFGRGIGKGLQKQGYLTEGHNDFIIANIVEEIGIIRVAGIYLLYLIIISKGYQIARQTRIAFDSLVALGVTTLFFLQAFWNSAGIIGLLPMKGLTAPLLSYGGTSLIIMLGSLGVLQRINIQTRQKIEKTKKEQSE
jgi:cell division protein FtsW